MSGWNVKEFFVGAHTCNQHHRYRSMEEVKQCNELAGTQMKNNADIDVSRIKLQGMDKCITMEEKRTERLERVGGCLTALQNMNLDLSRPDHLALVNKLLQEDNVSRNMRCLEPNDNAGNQLTDNGRGSDAQ